MNWSFGGGSERLKRLWISSGPRPLYDCDREERKRREETKRKKNKNKTVKKALEDSSERGLPRYEQILKQRFTETQSINEKRSRAEEEKFPARAARSKAAVEKRRRGEDRERQ